MVYFSRMRWIMRSIQLSFKNVYWNTNAVKKDWPNSSNKMDTVELEFLNAEYLPTLCVLRFWFANSSHFLYFVKICKNGKAKI